MKKNTRDLNEQNTTYIRWEYEVRRITFILYLNRSM